MVDTPETEAPSGCVAALAVILVTWLAGLLCGAGVVLLSHHVW